MIRKLLFLVLFVTFSSYTGFGQALLPVYNTDPTIPQIGWTYGGGVDTPTNNFDCTGNNVIRFNNTNNEFAFVNYASAATNVSFNIQRNSAHAKTLLVEESVDGITYTTVATVTNAQVTNNNTTYTLNYALNTTSRYVRFNMTARSGGAYFLDAIAVYNTTAPTCGACTGTTTAFYDSGGAGGNYSNNEDLTWTFYPDGGPVTATFTFFDLEAGWDYLDVYDGPDTGSPLIGSYTGTTIPGPFTSTDPSGALTFVFDSDGSTTEPGWEATICGTATPPACTTPVAPTNLVFNTVTDVVINGSFTGSGANNYLVLMNTSGTPPTPPTDGVDYNIGNTSLGATVIDNDGNTNFTANGLTGNTTYYFYIYAFNDSGCSGGPAYSPTSLNDDTTTDPPTYCTPSSTSSSYYIDDFTTTGGTTNITHNNSGFSAGGYGDFTAMNVTQFPGGNINFNINHVGGTFETNIWVDWNNDLDFNDPSEKVFETTAYDNPVAGNFIIPGVAAGNYRMRVRSDWSNTDVDSCGHDDRSETHDYTLIVTPLNCISDPINVTANATTTTTATISWTAPAPPPGDGYEYIISTDNTTGTPGDDITSTTTNTSINITGLSAGTTYYVFIRGVCNTTDQGVWVTTSFNTGCTDLVNTPTVCPVIIDEATNNPFTANPFIADPTTQLDCDNGDVTLAAHANLRETTSYIVEKIAYPNPAPNYDFPLLGGSAQNINTDDVWADSATTIPFDFSFYGQCYDEFLVGANGMVTFDFDIEVDPDFPSTQLPSPEQYCGWEFTENLPSNLDTWDNYIFEQTIYGVYHDIDPTGMSGTPIKSRVIGTSPCRQVQISWNNIPMFGDSSRFYTGMIVLHETTNIIEVFIEEKRIENGDVFPWNDGNAIVGIQGVNANNNPNNPANEYTVAPCRNGLDSNWETVNEAWRFVPNGAVINPNTVTWYEGAIAPGNIITANADDTVTVSAENTYFAVTEYTVCGNTVTLSDEILVTDSRKTWMGYIDDNWYVDGNWEPNGVPTPLDCVVIPDITVSNIDYPIADVNNRPPPIPPPAASALNLTIASTARLEVLTDTKLVVTDWIHLDGILNIRDSGSLIQINEGAPNVNNNTGNGVMNMQRTVPTGVNGYDYIYWSSPTDEDFNVTDISSATGELIYEWNPTLDGIIHGDWIPASGIMQRGKGYIVRGLVSTNPVPANTAQFSGRPQNGVVTVPITRGTHNSGNYTSQGDALATNEDDNWNLIGNPYPSAISYTDFISANSFIDGTIYFWTHQTGPVFQNSPFYYDFIYNYSDDYIDNNYTGSNPPGFNGDIAAGQAFFVLMLDSPAAGTSENITFNNTMRDETLNNSQFYRANNTRQSNIERHRIWLDLISPNDIGTSILVGYIEGATNGNDRLYDGFEFAGSNVSFYSLIEEDKMSIQGRSLPFIDSDRVPLGLVIPQNGNYSIGINTLDGLFLNTDQTIYIEDTYMQVIHDLRVAPYSFNIESGTYDDRFILRYTNNSLGVDEFNSETAISISAPGNNYIKIKASNSPIQTITVYDVLGRQLYYKNAVNQLEFNIDNLYQSDGVLFVKALLENGQEKVQKVVLKH